jgi:hypothetical protein
MRQNSLRLPGVVLGGLVLLATTMSGCIAGDEDEGMPRTLTVTGSTTTPA